MRYLEVEIQAKQYRVPEYQDSQIQINTLFLKSDTLHCFAYISATRYSTEDCLYSKCTYICHLPFDYKQFFMQYREAEIQTKQCRISDFEQGINLIFDHLDILLLCIVLPISQLPDIAQKTNCTQNVPLDVTFHLRYVPAFQTACCQRYLANLVAHFF